jgi:aspartyl-tRNA(Asn)/glutamyl-tRNA(Gln) amidotransferase subunit C
MIEKKEVKHIAALARIGINEKELEKYSQELSGILEWIEKLREINTDNVEPIDHITGIINISREDRVENFNFKKNITNLFPEKKDGYDKVKNVL